MLDADIVILNANIITLGAKTPGAEALAAKNGKIVAVGSNREIRKYINDKTRVVDAKGKTVVPGFVDCHVHMTDFGWHLQSLDLRDTKSIAELQQKLREYAEKNKGKAWILGGRWDHEKFAEKRLPTRWDLDKVISDKPVFLKRVCGHLGVANSKALQLANITREMKTKSGQIDLDAKGEPNGILRENALEIMRKAIPKPSIKESESSCLLACKKAVEAGLTGVHWMVDSANEIRVLQKLWLDGKLPLRVYLGISADLLEEIVNLGLYTGFGNSMLKIGFVKIFADGSLGARTAALNEPYSDELETSGMLIHTQRKLNRLALKAHKAGLQVGVHAIGDKAIESTLKAISNALKKNPKENHRHRIEHCSVLNNKLIKYIKRLNLVASVQPHFVVSDFWVNDRLGKDRARLTYASKALVDAGIVVVSGSDCPVEPINPLLGVWAAVAKANSSNGKLTVEEALKSYTLTAAYASFDEDKKGSVEVGKFADLTMLSDDLFSIPAEKLKDVSVEMTIVDGKIVYAKKHL